MSGLGWRSDIGACVSIGRRTDWKERMLENERGQYRKRPVIIEAVRLSSTNYQDVAEWCGARITNSIYEECKPFGSVRAALEIRTLEGRMIANFGDWVICGVKGEFYPCKDDIFRQSYEPQVYEAEVVE